MKPYLRYLILVSVVCSILGPWVEPALAEEPVLVSRRVETVTGAQIVQQLASQVTDVEFGADGVSVTLDDDGDLRTLHLGSVGAEGESVSGLAGLFGLIGLAATAMRVVGRFGRLFDS